MKNKSTSILYRKGRKLCVDIQKNIIVGNKKVVQDSKGQFIGFCNRNVTYPEVLEYNEETGKQISFMKLSDIIRE